MRNVVGLSAVLLVCVALSSCSGNRPEKAFMGTWKGTAEGKPLELSFMEKGIWIVKPTDSAVLMNSGTWAIDTHGNAVMTYDNGEGIATLMEDGRIAVRDDGVFVLEKTDKKN